MNFDINRALEKSAELVEMFNEVFRSKLKETLESFATTCVFNNSSQYILQEQKTLSNYKSGFIESNSMMVIEDE